MKGLAEVTVRANDLHQCSDVRDVLASYLISTLLHALPSEQENTDVRHKSPKTQQQLSLRFPKTQAQLWHLPSAPCLTVW